MASIYNLSGQMDAFKQTMDDVHEMCHYFGVEQDDTLIVLYQRGDLSSNIDTKNESLHLKYSDIKYNSAFNK